MRLVILCEGDTEKRVLKDFLAPYVHGFQRVTISNMAGSSRLVQEFKGRAELELQDDPEAVVFCLIDLLEAPFAFPRAVEQDADPQNARCTYIQRYMRKQIAPALRNRFHVFPVVMELETWLLADVEALRSYFRTNDIAGQTAPERVQQPAAELKSLHHRFGKGDYVKTIDGQALFNHASAERVYNDQCPHFEELVNALLQLQGIPATKTAPQFAPVKMTLFDQWAALQQRIDDHWETASRHNELSDEACQQIEALETQQKSIEQQL
jgi:hypothetical protein